MPFSFDFIRWKRRASTSDVFSSSISSISSSSSTTRWSVLERFFTVDSGAELLSRIARRTSTINNLIEGSLMRVDYRDIEELIKHHNGQQAPPACLENLTYENLRLSAEDMQKIAKLLRARAIFVRRISLRRCQLHGDASKILFQSIQLSTVVEKLDISYSNATLGSKDRMKCLCKMLQFNQSLVELNLSFSGLTGTDAQKLAKALERNGTLECLNLEGNNIGIMGATAMSHLLRKNTGLQRLNLASNGLQIEGGRVLAKALKANRTLSSLNLAINELSAEGCITLADALRFNTCLAHLSLAGNNIGHGIRLLCQTIVDGCNRSLRTLNLESNRIGQSGTGDDAGAALAMLIRHNSGLRTLILTGNHLAGAIEEISSALAENHNLLRLVLANSHISDEGVEALCKALRQNTRLQSLSLAGNQLVGQRGHWLLAQTLQNNTVLKTLHLDYVLENWEQPYNLVQTCLTRNHMLLRQRHAAAFHILVAARLIHFGRRKDSQAMPLRPLSQPPSPWPPTFAASVTPMLVPHFIPYHAKSSTSSSTDPSLPAAIDQYCISRGYPSPPLSPKTPTFKFGQGFSKTHICDLPIEAIEHILFWLGRSSFDSAGLSLAQVRRIIAYAYRIDTLREARDSRKGRERFLEMCLGDYVDEPEDEVMLGTSPLWRRQSRTVSLVSANVY
ncbi:uncharacterized protein VTP21DRAFT_7854 [Calcarisporiella thermophila]|uniref:uncharacterized protein n=1 Tax=Calcarisporiella thermophila TaxID=911321 RepID=UPI003742A89D